MKNALIIILSALSLMTALLAGCGGTKVTAYTESSQTINVKPNQEFTIALPANPTTGYDWKPVFEAGLISQIKNDYQQDDQGRQQLVGSGGTDLFTFKALKVGDTQITFTYYRPWETPKAEDKQQVFTIVIK